MLPELLARFEQKFQQRPRVFRAPGRVNLIGEHTDYNQGWVMPAAIEFGTWVAIAPRQDRSIQVVSVNFDQEFEFVLDPPAHPAKNWTDYVRGVASILTKHGDDVQGANIMIWGDVPLGAGLSSSASVEVASAVAMLANSGITKPKNEIAKLCQRAENEFVGARCGIMDQFVSANGRAGNALMLDCRSLEFQLVPLPDGISIVVANTMTKHQLSGSEYNTRRSECEEGVRLLQRWFPAIQSLRDVNLQMLLQQKSELPDVVFRRCWHVVTENQRVLDFAQALREKNLARMGELMRTSHDSLRDHYEVSCPELDVMVEVACGQPGIIGARMTGGGFGGCTVNLVMNDSVTMFQADLAEGYQRRIGLNPEIYVTKAADGVVEVPVYP